MLHWYIGPNIWNFVAISIFSPQLSLTLSSEGLLDTKTSMACQERVNQTLRKLYTHGYPYQDRKSTNSKFLWLQNWNIANKLFRPKLENMSTNVSYFHFTAKLVQKRENLKNSTENCTIFAVETNFQVFVFLVVQNLFKIQVLQYKLRSFSYVA